jgi:hypothetical protein
MDYIPKLSISSLETYSKTLGEVEADILSGCQSENGLTSPKLLN